MSQLLGFDIDALQFWPGFMPVGALLIGLRDLENSRFIERFA